jgi:hypothetical protein
MPPNPLAVSRQQGEWHHAAANPYSSGERAAGIYSNSSWFRSNDALTEDAWSEEGAPALDDADEVSAMCSIIEQQVRGMLRHSQTEADEKNASLLSELQELRESVRTSNEAVVQSEATIADLHEQVAVAEIQRKFDASLRSVAEDGLSKEIKGLKAELYQIQHELFDEAQEHAKTKGHLDTSSAFYMSRINTIAGELEAEKTKNAFQSLGLSLDSGSPRSPDNSPVVLMGRTVQSARASLSYEDNSAADTFSVVKEVVAELCEIDEENAATEQSYIRSREGLSNNQLDRELKAAEEDLLILERHSVEIGVGGVFLDDGSHTPFLVSSKVLSMMADAEERSPAYVATKNLVESRIPPSFKTLDLDSELYKQQRRQAVGDDQAKWDAAAPGTTAYKKQRLVQLEARSAKLRALLEQSREDLLNLTREFETQDRAAVSSHHAEADPCCDWDKRVSAISESQAEHLQELLTICKDLERRDKLKALFEKRFGCMVYTTDVTREKGVTLCTSVTFREILCQCLVDTGSQTCIIGKKVPEALGIEYIDTDIQVVDANGGKCNALGLIPRGRLDVVLASGTAESRMAQVMWLVSSNPAFDANPLLGNSLWQQILAEIHYTKGTNVTGPGCIRYSLGRNGERYPTADIDILTTSSNTGKRPAMEQ